MAGNDRRESTGVERRESMRHSTQLQDDDDDIEAMGISDGFRPMMMDNNMNMGGSSHNRMSSQMSQQTPGRRTPPPRPSSISKPRGIDSFALRHDGGMGVVGTRSSMMGSNPGPNLTRSSSVSTDVPFMRSESPYQGPSGPSHPYQMYPQESRLARTASVATTATMQAPERPYSGATGPTHPYGMYPQNTIEPEMHETPPVPPVPVGFPGLNNNYQRRLGPEGEEIAGIIGPDGHTEELPPYTQYPDEAFARKARPAVTVPAIGSGAGGIGLATRDPEFASREDLTSPQSRHSSRSDMSLSDRESNHNINMGALTASEKPQLKKWQQVARRRVCGIVPIWVLVLLGIVFLLFGIILGTVLAVLKANHPPLKQHHTPDGDAQGDSQTVTMTTTYDASPINTAPAGLPTLPTGTYALPISAPSTVQNSCLSNTQQSSAWSCTVPMSQYTISIAGLPGANTANNEINLTLGNSTFGGYYPYGTVPPVLEQTQVLHLVVDSQEPSRGPAWFFEMNYDKVVIVQENNLSLGGTTKRSEERDFDGDHSPSEFQRKNVAQPGDKPWFCYWNGTLLEAFIYVNLSSSAASQSSSSSTATPTKSGYGAASTSYGSAASSTKPPGSTSTSPTIQWLPAYPKVMKIEERRVPAGQSQSIAPYCVQYVIDANGNAHPNLNSTNQPITIYLNETEASNISQISGRSTILEGKIEERDTGLLERQTGANCGCVWLWT